MTDDPRRTVAAAAVSPDWRDITLASAPPGTRCRVNSAFRTARDRAAYPVWMVALVRASHAGTADQGGLPPAGELAEITSAGARAVAGAAVPGAVLVATSTTPASAEFVCYGQDQAAVAAAGQALRAALGGHRLTVQVADDPRWRGYRRLVREPRRILLGQLLLVLFPLLAGAMVFAHYGRWWALAELIACAAWAWPLPILALMRHVTGQRARPPRPPVTGRSGWVFAIFAWVFASAFFSIIALLAGPFLPTVAAAAIAVAAGLLVMAAVWPAQQRHTAMVRGRLLSGGDGRPTGRGEPPAGRGGPPAVG
jgi:hypothetical protein